jgi:dihydroneopterin aldolase
MGKIILENLQFYAYHGFYDYESKIGGEFVVNLEVELDFQSQIEEDNIEGTINYENLYAIVKEEMGERSKLLEHVAYRIKDKIQNQFALTKGIKVNIQKMNPPIQGRIGSVGVEVS